ncbi:MAG: CTP-dependent riboflavin kinase [Syntrophomonadaceae bacterium]|nr:CTP-dependent riboflavin kinase [Syntrophomonadaceae bacterium]
MVAEDRQVLFIEGKLVQGLGQGADFTAIPWVREEFKKRLGVDPYPGTLNIKLEDAEILQRIAQLKDKPGIIIPPSQAGFCSAKCFKVTVEGISGAVVFPEVNEYPLEKFEMIFPVHMKETLGLKDGDTLKVTVET